MKDSVKREFHNIIYLNFTQVMRFRLATVAPFCAAKNCASQKFITAEIKS